LIINTIKIKKLNKRLLKIIIVDWTLLINLLNWKQSKMIEKKARKESKIFKYVDIKLK